MSLDITLRAVRPVDVFSSNITHNLNAMAEAVGIYRQIWRPEEIGIETAVELIEPLRAGLQLLKSDPDRFKKYDARNAWGTYEKFLPWLEKYLEACVLNPDAVVSVSR